MKITEQWATLFISAAALIVGIYGVWFAHHLERDRFAHPFEVPVGVSWNRDKVIGGVNTVPVQYTDMLTLRNCTNMPLENVEVVVFNRFDLSESKVAIGNIEPGKEHRVDGFKLRFDKKPGGELTTRDVVVVRCDGYAEKRVPGDKLGKDRLLHAIVAAENKENDADKDYWRRYYPWDDNLTRQGVESTKTMYDEWFQDRQEERERERRKKYPQG